MLLTTISSIAPSIGDALAQLISGDSSQSAAPVATSANSASASSSATPTGGSAVSTNSVTSRASVPRGWKSYAIWSMCERGGPRSRPAGPAVGTGGAHLLRTESALHQRYERQVRRQVFRLQYRADFRQLAASLIERPLHQRAVALPNRQCPEFPTEKLRAHRGEIDFVRHAQKRALVRQFFLE